MFILIGVSLKNETNSPDKRAIFWFWDSWARTVSTSKPNFVCCCHSPMVELLIDFFLSLFLLIWPRNVCTFCLEGGEEIKARYVNPSEKGKRNGGWEEEKNVIKFFSYILLATMCAICTCSQGVFNGNGKKEPQDRPSSDCRVPFN